jgi:nucleoside-diphosphate-sugar epimerase
MSQKTILVTGGAGYVGSGVIRDLLLDNFRVVCVDKLSFGGESLLSFYHHPNFAFEYCDLNDCNAVDSVFKKYKFDGVIHLAAIVGDPACKLEPELARSTNFDSSVRLLDLTIKNGASQFIFASTCSNYGKMSDPNAFVSEDSPLSPVSLYAELKVAFEKHLLQEREKISGFAPTALRFSTVYGLSPRMRFDLTVNEFTKELALGRELVVFGEQFWRPYCHVKDFSRAFIKVLNSPQDKVSQQVYNVGDTSENYTKKMIVDEIVKVIPDSQIKYVQKNEDPRDYRVNSDRIKKDLGFEISLKVPDGIREVYFMLKNNLIKNPEDQRYYNIPKS